MIQNQTEHDPCSKDNKSPGKSEAEGEILARIDCNTTPFNKILGVPPSEGCFNLFHERPTSLGGGPKNKLEAAPHSAELPCIARVEITPLYPRGRGSVAEVWKVSTEKCLSAESTRANKAPRSVEGLADYCQVFEAFQFDSNRACREGCLATKSFSGYKRAGSGHFLT